MVRKVTWWQMQNTATKTFVIILSVVGGIAAIVAEALLIGPH